MFFGDYSLSWFINENFCELYFGVGGGIWVFGLTFGEGMFLENDVTEFVVFKGVADYTIASRWV